MLHPPPSARLLTTTVAAMLLASADHAVGAASSTPAHLATATPRSPMTTCDCVVDFDELVRNIEENYVGFVVGMGDDDRTAYERHKAALRERALRATGDECVFILRELTDRFGDGHLFIVESPQVDSAELRRLAATRERIERGEAELRAYLDANLDRLDPIEGIWYDRGLRVAIVRDEAPGRDFVAITLASDADAWEPGMVKAEFQRTGDGGYRAVLYARDHSTRHPYQVALRKGALLHMPPTLWGKAYPVTTREQAWLDPENPRAPTFRRLDERTVLFSIPSHDPQHAAERLSTLVEEHRAELLAAETMIIDLRGNEGGSSLTTRVLAPFYASRDPRPPLIPDGGPPALLSSDDHIAEAEANIRRNPNLPESILRVVDEMKARPGTLVRLPAELFATGLHRPDTIHATPRNVAILIDRGVVSAGEAFVLEAGRSRRVTLFGENTGGVIDYQNVKIHRLACPERGLLLGYPEFAGGHVLAGHGINGIGIAPHVRIPAEASDWVGRVVEHYRRKPR